MVKKSAFLLLLILICRDLSFGQTGVGQPASTTAQPAPTARQSARLPDKDAYLGEPRPGNIPRLFAPGRVSDEMSNRDMAISPAGDELFYTIQAAEGQVSVLLYMHFTHGSWSKAEVAPFSGQYSDLEPAFTADGKTLYFASNRPITPIHTSTSGNYTSAARASQHTNAADPMPPPKDYDIWMVKKENGQWGSPIRLDTIINSTRNEFYPSIARSGNLYFTRDMANGKGSDDIAISEWKDGKYQAPYSLSSAINTPNLEFNAFVDPDEQYLLFSSFGRKDDLGGGDLYLALKNDKGEWMPAIHLDSTINSTSLDFSPFVTWDKKYLFFTSAKMKEGPPFKKPLDFLHLKNLLESTGNGLNDIYWIEWQPLLKKYSHAG